MIQNHLLQILCLVAMEAPISFEADEVRNKKVDVLHAIRPIHPDQVNQFAVRGQYGGGWLAGEHIQGYRSEPNVSPESPHGNLCGYQTFCGQLALAGRPFLPAHR